jgi:hypothetical protein
MSEFVARKLVLYRTWLVAVINAVITWIILIIAPLGLLAVITCTVGVFVGSLFVGWVCDRALLQLIDNGQRDVMSARRESQGIDYVSGQDLDLPPEAERQQRRRQ